MTVVGTEKVRLVRTLRMFFAAAMAVFAGCGGNDIITYGTAVISVQSTNGGFLSYQVGVDSITLTRNDGIVVEPLAQPETVDFTQTTDIAELLGSPALPVGTYLSLSITLDYSVPSIWVAQNGAVEELLPISTASPETAMSTAVITVTFDLNHPLVINAQQSSRLALNINLAAFNTIDVAKATVTVQPFASAVAATEDATPMRARGLYVTELSVTNGFIMNARPFIDQVSALGAQTVKITPTTYFNINGNVYTGAAGLTVMAQQPENSLVVAYGTLGDLSGITPTFNATQVYAGLSVQTPLADEITGIVGARSADTLTILGGNYFSVYDESVGAPPQYIPTSTVTLGSGTIVSIDGSTATGLTPSAVSVGQQVTILGQSTFSATNALTIDATAGAVRLQSTRLWGTLNSAIPGSASLNLQSLQDFIPATFKFAGTGTAGQDATPAAYVVNTGTTDESGTAAGTLLQVDGMVTAFGAAPPDFTATTITPASATEQQLVVTWTNAGSAGGTVTPFTQNTAAGLIVNLSNANLGTAYIRTGPTLVNLTTLPSSPVITTANMPQANLLMAIGTSVAGATVGTDVTTTQTSSAATFVTAINTTFTATTPTPIYSLVAVGQYDSVTNTFNASQININTY
jgi:hypothetical protein